MTVVDVLHLRKRLGANKPIEGYMASQPTTDDEVSKNQAIADLFQKCRESRQAGDLSQAKSILATLSDRYAQHSSLRFKLEYAHTLKSSGQLTEATELLRDLQKSHHRNGHAFRIHAELLVEQGKYDEAAQLLEGSANQFDEQSLKIDSLYRAVKLRTLMADRVSPNTSWRPGKHAPVHGAVLIMMIRDEQDIILPNLTHHYSLGFRNFLIINNRSKDKTGDRISAFMLESPDAVVVQIMDPVVGYYQSEKTLAAVDFSRRYFEAIVDSLDWIFIIDADEFLSANDASQGLGSLLENAIRKHAEVMTFHLCNATTSGSQDWSEDRSVYEHFDIVAGGMKEIVLKNAFLSTLNAKISTGNHVIDYSGLTSSKILPGASAGWRIVHLPYRSIKQTQSKIINGAEALEARQGSNKTIGTHWLRYRTELGDEHLENAGAMLRRYRESVLRDRGGSSAPFKFQ